MAKQHSEISDTLRQFIEAQKIFFVGTAASEGRVNVSPKGMDTFRVVNSKEVVWLNLTGSGNESAAHVQQNQRMTIMFCAFDGSPMILRLFGAAEAIHRQDTQWSELISLFPPDAGARQIFRLSVDLVQTSCGFGVPLFDYRGERELLKDWSTKKGEKGIEEFWVQRNQTSIDGVPTHIVEKNTRSEDL